MRDEIVSTLASIATAIIGLAILSVIVSKNAQTSGVISSLAAGLGGDIQAATGPVTSSGGLGMGTINYGQTTQSVASF
jgi:ammonia channel protein AmtB